MVRAEGSEVFQHACTERKGLVQKESIVFASVSSKDSRNTTDPYEYQSVQVPELSLQECKGCPIQAVHLLKSVEFGAVGFSRGILYYRDLSIPRPKPETRNPKPETRNPKP